MIYMVEEIEGTHAGHVCKRQIHLIRQLYEHMRAKKSNINKQWLLIWFYCKQQTTMFQK